MTVSPAQAASSVNQRDRDDNGIDNRSVLLIGAAAVLLLVALAAATLVLWLRLRAHAKKPA
jgi:hypothetical protein